VIKNKEYFTRFTRSCLSAAVQLSDSIDITLTQLHVGIEGTVIWVHNGGFIFGIVRKTKVVPNLMHSYPYIVSAS